MTKRLSRLSERLIETYTVIGSVASGWSHLELQINVTLWRISGVEAHQGACLTAQIPSMRNRVLALVSLLHLNGYSKNIIDRVNKFSTEADKLARERNRIIHDPISASDDDIIESVTITSDRKLVYGFSKEVFERYEIVDAHIAELHKKYNEIDQDIIKDKEERYAAIKELMGEVDN